MLSIGSLFLKGIDILEEKKKCLNFKCLFNNFLYRSIMFLFSSENNNIFLKEKNIITKSYFFKCYFLKKLKRENFSFLFLELKKIFSFLSNFFGLYSKMNKIYFFRLKLRGLGFILKRYSKFIFSFILAVNHFYYFFVPKIFLLKKKKKHIICLSLDLVKLNVVFWHLLFLKKHNVYVRTKKLNGFVKTNFIRFVRKKYKL